jgi:peroxin-2
VYGLTTVGGRYAWDKWENWLVSNEGGYEEVQKLVPYPNTHADMNKPSATISTLSRLSSLVSTTHSMAAFISFAIFLINGRYRTLLDRILRLRLEPPTSQISRQVSFEYLNRQLVWHAFTEFLLFVLPLVGISRWKKWISKAWRKLVFVLRNDGESGDRLADGGELGFLPERTCAICYQDQNPITTSENEVLAMTEASGGVIGSAQTDITNPYETIPCGCIYCYVCLASRLKAEEGEGWVCLRCGELVKECKPWSGDVVEAVSRRQSGKSVSFSEDDKSTE